MLLRPTLVWQWPLPCKCSETNQSLSTQPERSLYSLGNQLIQTRIIMNWEFIQTQRKGVYRSCVVCTSLHQYLHLSSLKQQELRAEAWPALRNLLLPCLMHAFQILLSMFPRLLAVLGVYRLLEAGSQSHILQIIKFNKIGPSRQSSSTNNPVMGTKSTSGAMHEHRRVNHHRPN